MGKVETYLTFLDEAISLLKDDLPKQSAEYRIEKKSSAKRKIKRNTVLFILPYMSSDESVLTEEEEKIFNAWWEKSILLSSDEWSITSLIKEKASFFDREKAIRDKEILKDEIAESKSRSLVLMGRDLSFFILGKSGEIETLSLSRYSVNKIPTYVTWTPSDYLKNPNLKKSIWRSLLFIREDLKRV